MSTRRDNFRLAYRSLQAAKGRSFLTMLGIIIGVMAVVLVVCIGQGVKQQIAGQLSHYGKHVFMVRPGGAQADAGTFGGIISAQSSLLTEADLQTVQKAQDVAVAVPLSTVNGSVTGDYVVNTPLIIATSADFPEIIQQRMRSGGFFDVHDKTRSVVLGVNVARKLFNDSAPLGQALVWHGQRFLVAGVFDDFAAPPMSLEANFNDAVFIPYDVAQELSGSVLGVYQIVAKSASRADPAKVLKDVNAALVASHAGAEDIRVLAASSSSDVSDRTIQLITMLVAGAAAIALIVGGVGIMNMMLVSVTERMYEIGLRKALGATNRQIMKQFVAEAFVLSSLGAVIGVVLAAATVGLLRAYTTLDAVIVWQVMVWAFVAAVAVGVFFGSMPALKAARKDPIEALRHD